MTGGAMRFLRSGFLSPKQQFTNDQMPTLITQRKWGELISLLVSSKTKDEAFLYINDPENFAEATELAGGKAATLLHFACRFHPTFDVVRHLCEAQPSAPFVADSMGWYPLQVALRNGAGPPVIHYLLKKNPDAAKSQDDNGKAALHIASEHYALRYDPAAEEARSAYSRKEATYEVVSDLCKAAPEVVNIEDKEGVTAIEYALESDLPLRIVKRIQKVSEKSWKKFNLEEDRAAKPDNEELRNKIDQEKQRLQLEIMRMAESARELTLTGESMQECDPATSSAARAPALLSKRRSPPMHKKSKSSKAVAA